MLDKGVALVFIRLMLLSQDIFSFGFVG